MTIDFSLGYFQLELELELGSEIVLILNTAWNGSRSKLFFIIVKMITITEPVNLSKEGHHDEQVVILS